MPERTDLPFRRRHARPPRGPQGVPQMPFGQRPRPFPPIEFASRDQVEAIHQAA